jgi:endogenous inhibitor of DNA gyrase (YacG/DUF329 family)
MVKRVCQHCGKEYETFPSIRLQFCSMKCANDAKRRQKVTITCATCGKEKTVFPSQADQKYCSRSCAITARNLTDQNPSYKPAALAGQLHSITVIPALALLRQIPLGVCRIPLPLRGQLDIAQNGGLRKV